MIEQGDGPEVTQFDRPFHLTVTGTIDDRVIGGMTFYLAPPSAFGAPTLPGHPTHPGSLADWLCLNLPWKECEVEGEIDIKVRFRKK